MHAKVGRTSTRQSVCLVLSSSVQRLGEVSVGVSATRYFLITHGCNCLFGVLLQLQQTAEKAEAPLEEEDATWGLQPQQESEWVAPAATAADGPGDGMISLRVSAVEAYEFESKKDRSWTAMKKLEEEQRRGLQELRQQEALEFQQQQQQDKEQDAEQQQPAPEGGPSTPQESSAAAETKPWVSARVLRALEGGSFLRESKAAPVPSFEGDPDLATAVQMVSSSKQQQQQGKKQPQGRKTSPSDPQQGESPNVATSPKPDSSKSPCSVEQEEQEGGGSPGSLAPFVFNVRKYVSFDGASGVQTALSDDLVRAKYEARPHWTTLAVSAS